MEIFHSKWAFLIMGELYDSPKRFNELLKLLGCSTRALSNTLKLLEQNGILLRTVKPTVPVTVEYALTEKGWDFQKVFLEMRNWGIKWLYTEPEEGPDPQTETD